MDKRHKRPKRRTKKTKHGYFASLKTEYDGIDLDAVYRDLVAEFKPSTYTARILIRQLTVDTVRLMRMQRFEAEALREELNPPKYFDPLDTLTSADRQLVHEGEKAKVSEAYLKKIDPIYSRHENAVFNRIIKVLEIIKANQERV